MARGRLSWSAEEEAAIRDGVAKHGVGKWLKILDDPEFSSVLIYRTNVDLKDKWRNINLKMGDSRNGCKAVQKSIKKTSRQPAALTSEGSANDEIAQPAAAAIMYKSSEDGDSHKLLSRFHNCKLEGPINAKQPSSSTQNQREMEYDSADSESVQAAVDAELMIIRHMSPEDAAAAVALAFTKAEAAIAEAEVAEAQAVKAERDAKESKFIAQELKRKLEEKKARSGKAWKIGYLLYGSPGTGKSTMVAAMAKRSTRVCCVV